MQPFLSKLIKKSPAEQKQVIEKRIKMDQHQKQSSVDDEILTFYVNISENNHRPFEFILREIVKNENSRKRELYLTYIGKNCLAMKCLDQLSLFHENLNSEDMAFFLSKLLPAITFNNYDSVRDRLGQVGEIVRSLHSKTEIDVYPFVNVLTQFGFYNDAFKILELDKANSEEIKYMWSACYLKLNNTQVSYDDAKACYKQISSVPADLMIEYISLVDGSPSSQSPSNLLLGKVERVFSTKAYNSRLRLFALSLLHMRNKSLPEKYLKRSVDLIKNEKEVINYFPLLWLINNQGADGKNLVKAIILEKKTQHPDHPLIKVLTGEVSADHIKDILGERRFEYMITQAQKSTASVPK
jgi:hypothetical protein